jgi:hypothetical protein
MIYQVRLMMTLSALQDRRIAFMTLEHLSMLPQVVGFLRRIRLTDLLLGQ